MGMGSAQPLMAFLSRNNQLTEEESFDAMHAFGQQIKGAIESYGEWLWPGVGKLVSLNSESIGFVPEPVYQLYQQPVEAVRAIHSGRSHQMLVGDRETNTIEMQEELTEQELAAEGRWWMPALIVGIITIALISARLSGFL